jgi:hypothetical protein
MAVDVGVDVEYLDSSDGGGLGDMSVVWGNGSGTKVDGALMFVPSDFKNNMIVLEKQISSSDGFFDVGYKAMTPSDWEGLTVMLQLSTQGNGGASVAAYGVDKGGLQIQSFAQDGHNNHPNGNALYDATTLLDMSISAINGSVALAQVTDGVSQSDEMNVIYSYADTAYVDLYIMGPGSNMNDYQREGGCTENCGPPDDGGGKGGPDWGSSDNISDPPYVLNGLAYIHGNPPITPEMIDELTSGAFTMELNAVESAETSIGKSFGETANNSAALLAVLSQMVQDQSYYSFSSKTKIDNYNVQFMSDNDLSKSILASDSNFMNWYHDATPGEGYTFAPDKMYMQLGGGGELFMQGGGTPEPGTMMLMLMGFGGLLVKKVKMVFGK